MHDIVVNGNGQNLYVERNEETDNENGDPNSDKANTNRAVDAEHEEAAKYATRGLHKRV